MPDAVGGLLRLDVLPKARTTDCFSLVSSCLLCQSDLQRVYDGLFTALFPLSMIQDAEILVRWKGSHWTGYEKSIRRPIKDSNSEY
jgi:uncharacterized protein with PIN domain